MIWNITQVRPTNDFIIIIIEMINKIIQTTFLLLLFALLLFDGIPDIYSGTVFLNSVLFINLLATFSFFIIRKERFKSLKKQYFRFSYLFLISLIIVHFQAYIDLSLGIISHENPAFWVNINVINKAIVLASIGLISFYLGYSLNNNTSFKTKKKTKKIIDIRPLRFLNLLFFVLFLLLVDSDFLNSRLYGGGRRETSLFLGYSMLFFETSMFAIYVVTIYNKLNSKFNRFTLIDYIKSLNYSFIILIVYLAFIMLSGDRGPIIYLVLGFIIGFILVSEKKLSKMHIISLFIIGGFSITLLGLIRGSDLTLTELLKDNQHSVFYPKSFSPYTKELAGSVYAIQIAVDNVPEVIPHTKGLFFALNTFLLIPGLNSSVQSLFNINYEYSSSSKLLSFLYFSGGRIRWGVGTTCIADIYIDFGYIGVLIIFLLFGYFARYIELRNFVIQDISILSISLYILFFSFSIYIGRSSLLVPFTKLVYVLIFCYIPLVLKKQ